MFSSAPFEHAPVEDMFVLMPASLSRYVCSRYGMFENRLYIHGMFVRYHGQARPKFLSSTPTRGKKWVQPSEHRDSQTKLGSATPPGLTEPTRCVEQRYGGEFAHAQLSLLKSGGPALLTRRTAGVPPPGRRRPVEWWGIPCGGRCGPPPAPRSHTVGGASTRRDSGRRRLGCARIAW